MGIFLLHEVLLFKRSSDYNFYYASLELNWFLSHAKIRRERKSILHTPLSRITACEVLIRTHSIHHCHSH